MWSLGNSGLQRNAFRVLAVPALAYIFLAGCGYFFVGRGTVPYEGVKTVCISTFKNDTSEAGVENPFTQAIIAEFARGKWLELKCDAPDAVLEGRIRSYKVVPYYYTSEDLISGYQVVVVVEVNLVRNSDGVVLWSDKALTGAESAGASEEILTTKSYENAAVVKMARRMMESLYNRLSQNF
jgi:outer membrane lipopolysaccharide assembly protein LptE/RlpB